MRGLTLLSSAMLGFGVLVVCVSPLFPQEATTAGSKGEEAFQRHVLPTLKAKCFACHGHDPKLRGGLDLRTRTAVLKGGDGGASVKPGDAAGSMLYRAILRQGEVKMPPKESEKLSPEQIAAFKTWIDAGAPWPATVAAEWSYQGKDAVKVVTSGGQTPEWTHRAYKPEDIWAYQPLKRVNVPGPGHPLDAFLQSKLAEKGLVAADAADRRTLLRRATFDLTGLPPTSAEIDAFVSDLSPAAFDKVIERLLASPHYGEQMARHWLDVVRYADTSGFSNDFERPNAWRYRDYVIRAFNRDKPFDRFIVEQIAGDELGEDDPELLIAPGFLRMGPWEHTGMSVAAVTRQYYLDDVTNHVGTVFLAQPLRCASCHDHKFDPIPTRDYYRVQAVFAPVQFADREAPPLSQENRGGADESKKRTEAAIKKTRELVAALQKKGKDATAAYLKERGLKSIQDLPSQEQSNAAYFGLTPVEKGLIKVHQKRIQTLERELLRHEPYAFSVYTGPANGYTSVKPLFLMPKTVMGDVPKTRILERGSLESPGEEVRPGVLSAAASLDKVLVPDDAQGRRLAFARWVASPKNPLTVRVIVNRVWQWHFGSGLVAASNNFGKMGGRPTHPELLDWLAARFIDDGWSVKKLHRLIMTSAAYQRSGSPPDSAKVRKLDPGNKLLSYFPRRRLAAEEIRDAMLAVSGELSVTAGGPGVFPEINWEAALQPRQVMGTAAPAYQPSPRAEERNRRAIYAFRQRTLADPLLEVFNRPGSETSCDRRDSTTIAPQAFALFNGQFAHNRALALAARIDKLAKTPQERIDQAFLLVLGREPTARERDRCVAHLAAMTEHHRTTTPPRVVLPTKVAREMVEELTGKAFTFVEELDGMRDYQRDLQPCDVSAEVRALAEVCLVLLNSNEFLHASLRRGGTPSPVPGIAAFAGHRPSPLSAIL